ncbi:lytic murein transglycosylase [Rhodophyticola sp. CCM32]|uniref:lytic murein transglycosylase n=1 Tax=Rhodophyticola sp. CCM32 TaxID=2916397 RepID=UPI00107F9688|nr:lytic murein transglycosylase [Rhodophyticola sp. CCM32]QBY01766.1 lytic murein transglycosylase [Rhodophyticola sp. CCM32]
MRGAWAGFGILFSMWSAASLALPPDVSQRPAQRPASLPVTVSTQQADLASRASLRPVARSLTSPVQQISLAQDTADDAGFRQWIQAFQPRARAAGITQATLDRAFRDVHLNSTVIERDRNQSEFSRALWDYLDTAVSDTRVRNGRNALTQYQQILQQVERRYQVEAEVVAAIWGLESAYGNIRGDTNIIEAMATLAYEGRRQAFFEAQLLDALQILQSGDVQPEQMTGSWAGAMGHTQFMPNSYLEYAVDLTGDGRRDIWSDNPADALASTANYLRSFGWTQGQPWGMEVTLPRGFDYAQSGERIKRNARHWNDMGVRLSDGRPLPDHGPSSILLPAGAEGVALVIFNNFHVIERYNTADAYVIAVGHLSDRITGGPGFRANWPRDDRALSFGEREELQRRLTRAGFTTNGIDGIVGPETIEAVRRYQASIGAIPDGYASLRILQQLR